MFRGQRIVAARRSLTALKNSADNYLVLHDVNTGKCLVETAIEQVTKEAIHLLKFNASEQHWVIKLTENQYNCYAPYE